jgi:hypothetical protein
VKISLGQTIQGAQQFEFIRMDVGLESDVQEGEDRAAVFKRLIGEAEEHLKSALRGYKSEMTGTKKPKS